MQANASEDRPRIEKNENFKKRSRELENKQKSINKEINMDYAENEEQLEKLVLGLEAKFKSELDEYNRKLEQLSIKEIIDASYETVCKTEIAFCYRSFVPEVVQKLLTTKSALDTCYAVWLESDCEFNEVMCDSINYGLQF